MAKPGRICRYLLLATLVVSTVATSAAGSISLDLIEGSDQPTLILPAAMQAPSSGINVVPGSAAFVGRIGTVGDAGSAQSATFGAFTLLPFGTPGEELSMPGGILLTTGVGDVSGFNSRHHYSNEEAFPITTIGGNAPGTGGDDEVHDLLNPTGGFDLNLYDKNEIAFDFTVAPGVTSVHADFIFGTEEYPDQGVTDTFTVWVDDENYATFPDGELVRFLKPPDPDRFIGNTISGPSYSVEYDGLTRRLEVIGILDPGRTTHTIRFKIIDTHDQLFDSGVFIATCARASRRRAEFGSPCTVPKVER